MVPLEAPYPGVYIDTFIFFLRSLCKIIWTNVHYFPNAPRIYSLIIILPVLNFTIFFRFILSWCLTSPSRKCEIKLGELDVLFLSICGRKFLYLAKNFLNVIVFGSNLFTISQNLVSFCFVYFFMCWALLFFLYNTFGNGFPDLGWSYTADA